MKNWAMHMHTYSLRPFSRGGGGAPKAPPGAKLYIDSDPPAFLYRVKYLNNMNTTYLVFVVIFISSFPCYLLIFIFI